MSQKLFYDLCVIGGGLNGVSIARDAAGRGLSVLLVEAQDLAGASSSATSKVVFGGALGLESGSFSASLKSLKEREVLYKNVQHLFHPIACVMPLDQGRGREGKAGSLWRAKLWLYNKFRERGLFRRARFCVLNGDDKKLIPLKNPSLEEEEDDTAIMKPHERLRFLGNITDRDYALKLARKVMTFSACKVDDTRLVICNAIDAASRGAKISTYTSCDGLQANEEGWRVSLRDVREGDTLDVMASMVVNATGPWVSSFIAEAGIGKNDPDIPEVKFVKESHLILSRQYDGDHAYVLRQDDGLRVYVVPYEDDYTLVGAAREECGEADDPRDARVSEEAIRYLIDAYNAAFEKPVNQNDVVFSFSAMRPVSMKCGARKLKGDSLVYHHRRCDAPLISVYGGRMGEHRKLAQNVVDRLMAISGRVSGGWTVNEPLYSGKFYRADSGGALNPRFDSQKSLASYISLQMRDYPWLPEKLLRRYVYAYGTRMDEIVKGAHSLADLGGHFGDDVYEDEMNYLLDHEWVFDMEDALWRRSKLALHVSDETAQRIKAAFFTEGVSVEEDKKAMCA